MGSQKIFVINVLKWNDYNYRHDVKNPSWFRMNHTLFEDSQFFDFTAPELLSWLYILCQASKKSSGTINVTLKHVQRIGRIKTSDFLSGIKKLEELGIVTVRVTDEPVHVTSTCSTLHNRTEHNKTEQNNNTDHSNLIFNKLVKKEEENAFEQFWKLYPSKENRSPALKAFLSKKPPIEDLITALEKYKKFKPEWQAWKNGSTFINQYQDFLREDYGAQTRSLVDADRQRRMSV